METTITPNRYVEDTHGYTKEGKVYLKGYAGYPDREIGYVRNTEEEALDYFRNRFQLAQQKVIQLHQDVQEAQNKGSYLTKLLQLRKNLLEFDGLGDFPPLLAMLDKLETYLRELISSNQVKNLEIKRALLEEVHQAATAIPDWNEATDKIQEIKTKWLKTGPVDKPYHDEIEGGFDRISDDFFQRRREYYAEQNRIIDERFDKLEDIVAESEKLMRSTEFDEAFVRVRQLQNEWKTVGPVPPKRQSKLWKRFKKATTIFFDRYNAMKGITPRPRVDPRLQELQNIAAEAETLTASVHQDVISKASDRAKELLVKWKDLAPKVKTLDRNVAEKFRLACDKVFELNYLRRVIGYRYPDFDEKPKRDQLKIQIYQMEYLVRKEKGDLEQYLEFDGRIRAYVAADKALFQKVNTQKRKVAVKEMLLVEFKRDLETVL
ncbi:DUF349 domain-containing protein [Siphonobacter curvatus]|uniref:DUF349 domain-containing protein n=1 Tax=Siphonobacter curvatus TaxID=2094562 RepID=A0A2S7IIQ8_9BACT|nr:DUF349 domain-containing protein [Siphonobacter curvatus]PQA56211.1 DUF349 domain-containing protein [Siphonobacter curvatus]